MAGEPVEVLSSDEQTVAGTPPAKRPRCTPTVTLGKRQVDPVGLGTMPLGIEYPDPKQRPLRAAALALLHAAFRSGVEVLDTADSYCAGPGGSADAASPHYVEGVIAEAIRTYRGDASKIRVCTKGGMQRINNTSRGWRPRACSMTAVRQMIAKSYEALGGQRPIDVYMLHHTDTLSSEQLEEALLAMQEAVREGKVHCLGLANATIANLEVAERLGVEIAVVQNQYSLWHREAEMVRDTAAAKSRKGVLGWCTARGVAFMPYGVLGGVQNRDGRRCLQQSFPRLLDIAAVRRVSPEALLLAWMRQRFPCIIHIVGARSRQHVLDCAVARHLRLSPNELEEISALKPASGAVKRAPSIVEIQFVHLEPSTLSLADMELLHDLSCDLKQLTENTGAEVTVHTACDRFDVRGGREQRASAIVRLDEVLQFYFGQGIPH